MKEKLLSFIKDFENTLPDNTLSEIHNDAIKICFESLKDAQVVLSNMQIQDADTSYQYGNLYNAFYNSLSKIKNFTDIHILNRINFFINKYSNGIEYVDFYCHILKLHDDLLFFKQSGLAHKNYTRTLKNLKKQKEYLQQFTSKKIELDLIPKFPSDAIHDFFSSRNSFPPSDQDLALIELIGKHLDMKIKPYKKTPTLSALREEHNETVKDIFRSIATHEPSQQELNYLIKITHCKKPL